jgi:DNA-binding response OmpR family regulator
MTSGSTALRDRPASASILVVESDLDLGRSLAEQLAADGYRAALARTAAHAQSMAREGAPMLTVLGGLDPPRGALDLLEEIRDPARAGAPWEPNIPVIMVGGPAPLDVLRGFEAGADDFLSRPARYLELRARLRAILRRAGGNPDCVRALRIGPLTIEPNAHSATLREEQLDLRRLEFQPLMHLASEPTRVFGKDELLRTVWGYRASGSTRTVDSHASRLRRKLEARGGQRWVINVWGVGYRLI